MICICMTASRPGETPRQKVSRCAQHFTTSGLPYSGEATQTVTTTITTTTVWDGLSDANQNDLTEWKRRIERAKRYARILRDDLGSADRSMIGRLLLDILEGNPQ